ncbi:MAG TPA: sugar kinase, partial [Bacteroidetes bacterium]|nr:sugar kinase [Bacteroidota bacterium]
MSLLVVGSVAYDGTETPFGKRYRVPGGSATFLSLSASFFTNPVHLIGIVGKDYAAEDIQRFEKRGIDLEGLQRDDSGDTFYYASKYSYDLNHRESLQTDLNVFERFDPVLTDVAKKANVVALGNIEPRLQLRVLDQVEKPKFVAMDTMNFWIEGWNEQLKETIARVDMLVVNDSEARELTGEHSLL